MTNSLLSTNNSSLNGSSHHDCYNFSNSQYIGLLAIRVTGALLSFLACLMVIGIIVLFKKYLFQTQRLILYLDIALLLRSFSQAINNIQYKDAQSLHIYCVATGYLDLYTSQSVVIAIGCFTMDIFLKATCKCVTDKAEALYVCLIFVAPVFVTWIPFTVKAYGFAGAWCWIKEYGDDCSIFAYGILLQFCLYYIPLFVLYPVLFILLLITLFHLYRKRYSYAASVDPQTPQRRTALRKEIKSLLPYPCIVLFTSLIPLITRIYRATDIDHDLYALWVIDSFFTSIQGAVIAILFTLDPETRHRLRWKHIKAAFKDLCKRRIQEYHVVVESMEDSLSNGRSSTITSNSMVERSILLSEDIPEEEVESSRQFTSIEYQQMND